LARSVINFPSLKSTVSGKASTGSNGSIFVSLAFCRNVNANVHIDSDMCQGLIVLHEASVRYLYRQHSLAYFCFSCLGVFVSLRSGNTLISIHREPPCFRSPDDLFKESNLVAIYLKTGDVGLNSNSLPLVQIENYIHCKLYLLLTLHVS
jgi:hypothetical protein